MDRVEGRGRRRCPPDSWMGPEVSGNTVGIVGPVFVHLAPLTRSSPLLGDRRSRLLDHHSRSILSKTNRNHWKSMETNENPLFSLIFHDGTWPSCRGRDLQGPCPRRLMPERMPTVSHNASGPVREFGDVHGRSYARKI